MLPKQPRFEPDQQAGPVLSRRRQQLIGVERDLAPTTDPSARPTVGMQPSLLPDLDAASDSEPAPDIPPSPRAASPLTADPSIPVRSKGRGRVWVLVTAVAGLAVVGAGSFLLLHTLRGEANSSGEIPYVTADAGPEKVRPQQEGGLQVPNQDMGVYNELNGNKQASQPDVLLPQPETPVTPPVAAAAPPANTNAPPAAGSTDIPTVPAPDPNIANIAPAAGTPTQPPQTAEAPASSQSADQAAPAAPVQTASTTGAFRIQLAAVKSQDAAQAAWKKLTKSFPDVLGGMKLNVAKVDRGSDGVLYRVQAGSFADRSAAETACVRLKTQNQACLVVAP